MNAKMFSKISVITLFTFFAISSNVSAEPFDGQLKLIDDATGTIIDEVTITGDINRPTLSISIDDVLIDGNLLEFNASSLREPGPTIFATFENAAVLPGFLGGRINATWKGNSVVFINLWVSFQTSVGSVFISTALPNAVTAPGGLIEPGIRAAIYIFGVAVLGNVSIDVTGGNVQECAETGGTNVSLQANYELTGAATSVTVDWSVDGNYIGSGENISTLLTVGQHNIEATVIPNVGAQRTVNTNVEIRDTTRPVLDATFQINGVVVSSVPANSLSDVEISMDATDICDPNPVKAAANLSQVYMVDDGEIIQIQATGDRVELATTAIKLVGTYVDASGNSVNDTAVLDIEN